MTSADDALEPGDDVPRLHPCGLLRRVGAIVYDTLILVAVLFAATVPLVLLRGGAIEDSPAFTLYLVLVAFAFFGGFWTHGGQTLGMKAWRIRLYRADGTAVSWRAAGIRFAAAILSWLPAAAGYWWCLLDRDGLAWHDRVSGTRLCVIRRG